MNIAKNMEAIFILAVALAGVTSLATAAVPAPQAAKASVVAAQQVQGQMQVVTIVGKRAH